MKVYLFPLTNEEASADNAIYKGINYALENSDRLLDYTDFLMKAIIEPSYIQRLQRVVVNNTTYDLFMEYFFPDQNASIFIAIPRAKYKQDALSDKAIANLGSL